MRRQTQGWVTVGALGVLALLAASGTQQLAGLDAKIALLVDQTQTQASDKSMDTLTTVVENQAGVTITVNTDRLPGEEDADQLTRHLKRVALAEASGG